MPELLSVVQAALQDRYEVHERTGHGGMSYVFSARDLKNDEDVAIKVLRPEYAMNLAVRRFHREIRFLSSLDHPNILPILTSGETKEFLYFTTPFAHDDTLRAKMNKPGMLSTDEACSITSDIAAALDYAHAQNLVHRDMKPENVLFDDGRVLVCDFGVARAMIISGGETFSSSGLLVGTPGYMSPEQCSGDEITNVTDIYALGCVTYEMLTGGVPFTGVNTQAVMAKQVHETAPKLRIMTPDVPEHIERAVEWAMEKDPKDRPETATEFAKALSK